MFEHEEWFQGSWRTLNNVSVGGVGGFRFLLALFVLLYSKASYDSEQHRLLFCFDFLQIINEALGLFSDIKWLWLISPTCDPACYTRASLWNIVPDIDCAYIPQQSVGSAPIFAAVHVGFIDHRTAVGYTFTMNVATSSFNLPDLVSPSTHIDHHTWMHQSNSHCTSQTRWFELMGTPALIFETRTFERHQDY